MLRLVDKHRLLTAAQLWAVLGGGTNWRAFLRRLAMLFHAGVLDRPRAQFRPGQPSRSYIYAVGPLGRRELDRLDAVTRRGKRDVRAENARLKLQFIDHETATAEVALAFQLATERQGWNFQVALDDEVAAATGLPSSIDVTLRDGSTRVPLRPDCHLVIDAGEGSHREYLVEVDLGTEPQIRWNLATSSIVRKTIAYWQLSFWQGSPVDGVIFVTTTRRRLRNMIEVVRRVDPKGKGSHYFHFALLDDCRIENYETLFYAPLFFSAKTSYDRPRPLFLDTCPNCNQFVDPQNEAIAIATLNDEFPAADQSRMAHVECPGLRR